MPEFLSSLHPGLVGGILGSLLILALQPLFRKLWLKRNNMKFEDYDRNLSEDDNIWLNQTSFRLSQEKSQQKYPRWTLWLTQGLIPVSITAGATFGISYLFLKILSRNIDESAITWLRLDIGASSVLSLFLGIFLAALIMIILSRYSPTIRDYLTYHYGWGYAASRPRGETEIHQELEHQFRIGEITSQTEYDSEYLSNLIFHRTTPIWKKGTLILFLFTLILFLFDSQYHYTIYPNKIEASSYFSLKSKKYSFEDITTVKRRCILAVNKKKPYSRFEYIIEMEDGNKLNLLSDYGPIEGQQFLAIETLLPSIPKSAFKTTQVKKAPILDIPPTLENCRYLLEKNKSEETTKLLKKLFHL